MRRNRTIARICYATALLLWVGVARGAAPPAASRDAEAVRTQEPPGTPHPAPLLFSGPAVASAPLPPPTVGRERVGRLPLAGLGVRPDGGGGGGCSRPPAEANGRLDGGVPRLPLRRLLCTYRL